jgi:hypothetical protein
VDNAGKTVSDIPNPATLQEGELVKSLGGDSGPPGTIVDVCAGPQPGTLCFNVNPDNAPNTTNPAGDAAKTADEPQIMATPGAPIDNGGGRQEQNVRSQLITSGYSHAPYGDTDAEIRSNLGIKGKVADNVRFNPETNQWIVAESKGDDILKAVQQLQNTHDGLIKQSPQAIGNVEVKVYTHRDRYNELKNPEVPETTRQGYLLDEDGYLKYFDEMRGDWVYETVNGIRVKVEVAQE